MKLLLSYIKKYKKTLVGALVLATINQVFSLLDPQIFRLLIDNYATRLDELSRQEFLTGILLLLGASVGVALVSRIAKNIQDYYVSVITERVGTTLYADSVEHSFSLPYAAFEDQRSGELLRKLQKARDDSQKLITSSINVLFLSLVGVVIVVGYAFYVHYAVGLLFLATIPVLGFTTLLISKKIKEAQEAIVVQSASMSGSTTETLRNVELVKSLGLESQETKRLNDVNDKILLLELKKARFVRILSFIQGTMVNLTRASVLFLMLWLIFRGQVSLGEFFTLWFYSFAVFNPLYNLGEVVQGYQEARASLETLDKVFQMPLEPVPIDPVRVEEVQTIEFKEAGFAYASSKTDSLKDISFEVTKGETVAFVGPSGAGKSTLIKTLVGLYTPTEGQVLVNGTDFRQVDRASFRRLIGYVSQEAQLFAGTVRENLRFVNPEATDEDCLQALHDASAENILERTGEGLETKIGEGGLKLSGGERQRLAVARALLRDPDIVIFDEATSSLDSITEKAITETMRGIEKKHPNLITFLVAHRLSTVSHADVIYVLEKGKIVESGTHEELLKEGGLYFAMWREQIASSSTKDTLNATL